MPLQFAFAGAVANTHRHTDIVIHQIAHHLTDGTEPIEQLKYQANRCLRLLVGVQDNLA